MKIFLNVNQSPISGYKNVNLTTDTIDLNNLDNLCEPSECTDLIIHHVLEYISFSQIPTLLSKLISRLRLNGQIVIHNYDFAIMLDNYHNGLISLQDLNDILFGNDSIKKCCCISIQNVEDLILENGLSIISKEINAGKFTLIARRTK